MRSLVLLSLLLSSSLLFASASIEFASRVGPPDANQPATAPISPTSPCVLTCGLQLTQCNEGCVFDSASESEEFDCRGGCTRDLTRCVTQCAARAAPASKGQTAPIDTFAAPVKPPRPSSENVGYGPETVANWAGYISVNGSQPTLKRHLFYWFFESRNQPATDPLVIWLTGGPGCSSLVALFYENGPYIIGDDLSLSLNPNSWNSNASVIWIDQPVNTGYSYADPGDWGAFSEDEIADNAYFFLQGFLEQYPKYKDLPFYITGESYAGHYIPAIASRILEGNQDPQFPPINLQAIAIGNGLVNPELQYQSYAPFASATGVLPSTTITAMESAIPSCVAAIQSCAQNTTSGLEACLYATEICNLSQMMPFQLTGLNVYDVREKCAIPPLCYNFTNVDAFLEQPQVIEALGVQGRTWQDCNKIVDLELIFAGDWMRNLATDIPNILGSGVRVVVYSGEYDFICNWYGGSSWTKSLQWSGQSAFNLAQNTTWISNGAIAGSSRTAYGFTFVRVKDAGHMVPLNQPAHALDMLERLISGRPFDDNGQQQETNEINETDVPAIALE